MNTTIQESLTPIALVARAACLEPWALEKLEPSLRGEENGREMEGQLHLSLAGIRAVARALERSGYAVKAHSVRVLANQQEHSPSRLLLPPIAKNADIPESKLPFYRRGSMA